MPNIGKNVCNLKLMHGNEIIFSFSQFIGINIILYFYPKDNTPSCTQEAKDFTSLKSEFDDLNTIIIGVSTDSNQTHNKFIAKYNLKLKLLSDVDNTLCEYFDIWVEKNMYGKKFMGIERSTFLINTSGIIIKEWRKVKVNGHAEMLLETVREL